MPTNSMPKTSLISVFALLIAQAGRSRPSYSSQAWRQKENDPQQQQCGVYLAESSTGHTLGSFAGRNYMRNDIIGTSDSVVHFVDIRHYNPPPNDDDNDDEESSNKSYNNHARLEQFLGTCWSADSTGGKNEADEVISAVGGPAFSSTGHVGLVNAIIYQPSILLRTDTDLLASGKFDELTSPGRGAFSTYHNLTILAVDRVVPGMEIFLDFGSEYSKYDDPTIPNMDDYRKMDEGMGKMVEFFNKHAARIGEKAAEEVYEFIKEDVLDLLAERRAPAARALLPESYHGLQEIIDRGGSALYSNPEVVRDVDWLKMNGYCMDNLVVGASTIEHAGRGAFAARSMKRGEVVGALPLVALHRGKSVLTIPEEEDGDKETYQLLYNYMLEHPQSSALFYPAGATTNYINHGGQNANVKMIWSTKEWSNAKVARETSLENLFQLGPIDMIVELVATRPINKGEEILLDYGEDWATAWKEHVSKWKKATKKSAFSKSAMTLNEVHHGVGKPPLPFPFHGDEANGSSNVELKCHLLYDDEKIERIRNKDGSRTKVYPWIPHSVGGENRLKSNIAVRSVTLVGCDIMDRLGDEQSGYKYVVRPHTEEKGMKILVKNVPHYAIRYVDKPYTNPQHEPTSFRHPIRFPDEIFPSVWKDLASGVEESPGRKDEL
jgi:hypothetical protein